MRRSANFWMPGAMSPLRRPPNWGTLKVQLPPGTLKPPESTLIAGAVVFVGTSGVLSLQKSPQ